MWQLLHELPLGRLEPLDQLQLCLRWRQDKPVPWNQEINSVKVGEGWGQDPVWPKEQRSNTCDAKGRSFSCRFEPDMQGAKGCCMLHRLGEVLRIRLD